jgi:hypothetical protein
MIEPHNAVTVSIPPAMPPKREAKISVPLSEAFYAKLLADEAKAVRARHGNRWGHLNAEASGNASNERASAEAVVRREELAAKVLACLDRPRTRAEIIERMGVTASAIKQTLSLLRQRGQATVIRVGLARAWERLPG